MRGSDKTGQMDLSLMVTMCGNERIYYWMIHNQSVRGVDLTLSGLCLAFACFAVLSVALLFIWFEIHNSCKGTDEIALQVL